MNSKQCPKCSRMNAPELNFCSECGTQLPAQGGQMNLPEEPAPTVFSGAVVNQLNPTQQFNPGFQQPQSNPNFNSPPTPQKSNKGKILLAVGAVLFLFVGAAAVAGILIFMRYNRSESYFSDYKPSVVSTTPASNTKTGTPPPSSSSNISEPVLYGSRNGFDRMGEPYTNEGKDYPGATATKAALYSKGSVIIHGEASVYSSKSAAVDGFDAHLKKLKDRGATVTSRGEADGALYAYYKIDTFYGFCVVSGISIVDYSTQSMSDLTSFLK